MSSSQDDHHRGKVSIAMKTNERPDAIRHVASSSSSSSTSTSSPLARILSGSVGSIVYVLGFTPLEVVKVRQQAAGIGGGGAASSPMSSSSMSSIPRSSPLPSLSSSVKAFHRGRGLVTLHNGLKLPANAFPCLASLGPRRAAAAANNNGNCNNAKVLRAFESTHCHASSSSSSLLSSPSRVLAGRNVHLAGESNRGILRTLSEISRVEGRAGLYAGLRPTLLAAVPNTAIYFAAYDEIADRLRGYCRKNDHDANNNNGAAGEGGGGGGGAFVPLAAGASARLLASMATAPLELVRVRQAGSVALSQNTIADEFRAVLRTAGPLGLYRGLGPMILRDVPFSAAYFLGLETFKDAMSRSTALGPWGARHYRERGARVPASVEAVRAFVSGIASGAIAVVLTTPFDLVKTRRQVVAAATAADRGASITALGLARRIAREEGLFRGLWKGNTIRMIKVAPGCAIMISCYELGKRFFEDVV